MRISDWSSDVCSSDLAEVVAKGAKDFEHLIVVQHVERANFDTDARMRSEQFGLELVEPFGAARAQREIATARGELAGHAAAQAGAGAGDEDGFAHIDHSCVQEDRKSTRLHSSH